MQLATCRVLTALSAACVVGAFAIAALAPVGLTLAGLVARVDPTTLPSLQHQVLEHLPAGMWRIVLLPFLARPAWLLPLMLGIVGAGLSLTMARAMAGEAARSQG